MVASFIKAIFRGNIMVAVLGTASRDDKKGVFLVSE
jgi:hypothetical protein